MGYVKITHSYHPLRGQKFPVLKERRVSGVETLVLRGSTMGTFAVPKEWTDKGNPLDDSAQRDAPILDFRCLLTLRDIIHSLDSTQKKG